MKIQFELDKELNHLFFNGDLTLHNISNLYSELSKLNLTHSPFTINFEKVSQIDITGIQLIVAFVHRLQSQNIELIFSQFSVQTLLNTNELGIDLPKVINTIKDKLWKKQF